MVVGAIGSLDRWRSSSADTVVARLERRRRDAAGGERAMPTACSDGAVFEGAVELANGIRPRVSDAGMERRSLGARKDAGRIGGGPGEISGRGRREQTALARPESVGGGQGDDGRPGGKGGRRLQGEREPEVQAKGCALVARCGLRGGDG
nr:hypothetical protein CFP56_11687 [Quercus suber]